MQATSTAIVALSLALVIPLACTPGITPAPPRAPANNAIVYGTPEAPDGDHPWLVTPLTAPIATLVPTMRAPRETRGPARPLTPDWRAPLDPLNFAVSTWTLLLDRGDSIDTRATNLLRWTVPELALARLPVATDAERRETTTRVFIQGLDTLDFARTMGDPAANWHGARIDYSTYIRLPPNVQQGWLLQTGLEDLPERLYGGWSLTIVARLLPPTPVLIAAIAPGSATLAVRQRIAALHVAMRRGPPPPTMDTRDALGNTPN